MKNKSPIILLLLSVALFYTFTNVEYKKVTGLQAQANDYKDILSNVSDIVRFRDSLLLAYEEFPEEDITRINRVLPDNVDAVRLALELDSMASKYGISIQDINVEQEEEDFSDLILPENSLPYQKVTVSFSFISSYDNLKRFLSDMERNLRIMEIKSLSFDVKEDATLYEHELAIETYWLKE